jgi:ferredoxin
MYLEVDEGLCIACRLCEERAPENLAMDDDDHAARVIKQPVGETEMASCAEAVEYCPTAGLIATTPTAKKNAA